MEDKRLLIVGIIMIVIGAITATTLFLMRTKTKLTADIVKIEYSYGSNYGTRLDCATYKITITNDGTVTFSNNYHEDYTESYTISMDKYNDLITYIKDHMKVFDIKDRTDNNVMDGGFSNIKIKLADNTIYESGGSNPSGNNYKEMTNKIVDTVNMDKVNEYRLHIKELGE